MKKERDYEYIKGLAFIGVCALVLVLVFLWLDGRHEPEPVKYEYGAGYEFIRLTGVTFDNSAGESRQELLKKLKERKPPFATDKLSIWAQRYEYEGRDAYRVYINGCDVGNIPAEKVSWFKKHEILNMQLLGVDGGHKLQNGERAYYGIELIITYK